MGGWQGCGGLGGVLGAGGNPNIDPAKYQQSVGERESERMCACACMCVIVYVYVCVCKYYCVCVYACFCVVQCLCVCACMYVYVCVLMCMRAKYVSVCVLHVRGR